MCDIFNYKLPNRKKKLLTKKFLQTFKEEIIKLAKENDKRQGVSKTDYDNETYYSFYSHIEGTYLFYEALKNACVKHNIVKSVYEYAVKLPWYDSDIFDDEIVYEMVNKSIIKMERPEDNEIYKQQYLDADIEYKLIKHCKGYNVIKYGYWFSDDKEQLEEIYSDREWELIWL